MVYIDSMNAPYRRMIMNHMMADTTEELLAMADTIGVARKWIQEAGTPREHFDVCLSMKKKALALGATEVGWREIANLCNRKLRFYLEYEDLVRGGLEKHNSFLYADTEKELKDIEGFSGIRYPIRYGKFFI